MGCRGSFRMDGLEKKRLGKHSDGRTSQSQEQCQRQDTACPDRPFVSLPSARVSRGEGETESTQSKGQDCQRNLLEPEVNVCLCGDSEASRNVGLAPERCCLENATDGKGERKQQERLGSLALTPPSLN